MGLGMRQVREFEPSILDLCDGRIVAGDANRLILGARRRAVDSRAARGRARPVARDVDGRDRARA
jgi:hypothetical protein